jgi:hypothetical protein
MYMEFDAIWRCRERERERERDGHCGKKDGKSYMKANLYTIMNVTHTHTYG